MKLAINFSHAAQTLAESGSILFDLWKSGPNHPQIESASTGTAQPRPTYLHFPLDLGTPDFADRTDWDKIERLLDDTNTPFLNVHLNARRADFSAITSGADTARERSVVRDRFLRHLDLAVARFGAKRVIAENVIYRGESGPYLRSSVEPDLICDVIQESGCSLLLDTAHARVTCAALSNTGGIDPKVVEAYISALPCDRLRELHVTGAQRDGNGRLRDSMSMGDGDWATAEWVLNQIGSGRWSKPWIVALEYGGVGESFEWRSDPQVIERDLSALQTMMAQTVYVQTVNNRQ